MILSRKRVANDKTDVFRFIRNRFPAFVKPLLQLQKLSLKKGGAAVFGLACCLALCSGCSGRHALRSDATSLPEDIYISGSIRQAYSPRIAIWQFSAPEYAESTGEKAAFLLYTEILKRSSGMDIIFVNEPFVIPPEDIVQMARRNKYDILITGKILHYLEGGISADSRVDLEVMFLGIFGESVETIGHAKAVEKASPSPRFECLSVMRQTRPALPAECLLKKNAEKFALMFNNLLPNQKRL